MTYLYVDYPFYKKFTIYATTLSVSINLEGIYEINEYPFKIFKEDVLIA